MKTQSTTLFNPLVKGSINSLTTIVEETLDKDFTIPVTKTFTSAELWNIQRQKRTVHPRRSFF